MRKYICILRGHRQKALATVIGRNWGKPCVYVLVKCECGAEWQE